MAASIGAAHSPRQAINKILAGSAEERPIDDSTVDGAWLSTVTHHITDLPASATELRRVLRPGAPVLIRNFFPGRTERVATVLSRGPPGLLHLPDSRAHDRGVHQRWITPVATESVPQQTAPNLAAIAAKLDRNADTALQSLSDAEFAAGMARLRAAATRGQDPVVDYLDLLVLQ